jgi:hypothetical protein
MRASPDSRKRLLLYVNYINLHAQNIPIPKGKQAHFCGECRRGHSLSLAPLWGRADRSLLGAGRVSVVDLGEVSRPRKLALRRRARGGATRGLAGDSEVVQNLAYRFWLWWQQGRPRQRLSEAQPTSFASLGASHIPWGLREEAEASCRKTALTGEGPRAVAGAISER